MGDESLVGITDLVSGEKDPRNLMLIFSMLKVIMVEWDISNYVQVMFDAVFNYFPITFRPPPNDPYGITAQDLKSRLRECIASNRLFAPHAFPSLIDKLDSASTNVKKDTLQTMAACSLEYDEHTMSLYSITIWDALKFEILNFQEEELAEEALNTLKAVAVKLKEGAASDDSNTSLARYLKPICKECNENLQEPQQKQTQQTKQIMKALSATSPIAFTLIIKAVLAPFFTIYQDADSIAKQRSLLEALNSLLESAVEVFGSWKSLEPRPKVENPLDPFREQLSEVLSQALMSTIKEEVSFRVAALKGLVLLSQMKGLLQDNEIGMYVQYFDEIVLKEESYGKDELKQEAIAGLAEISKHKPHLIMNIAFPAFMATLPDSDSGDESAYITTLESLAQISTEKEIFETLLRRLLGKLDVLLHNDAKNASYPHAILSTILFVMKQRGLENDPNLESYFDKIVVGLTKRAVLPSVDIGPKTALNDIKVLETLGRISTLIVRNLPSMNQHYVASNIYSLFSEQDGFHPVPFASSTTPSQCATMVLSTYLLAGLPKETATLPYTNDPDMSGLLRELVQLAIKAEEPATSLAILRQASLLANKFLANKSVELASTVLFDVLKAVEEEPSKASLNQIRAIFWLSKALILRLAPSTPKVLDALLSLLTSPSSEVRSSSARGFSLLLSPDEVLSAANGATIRLLCKQRVFTTLVPMIADRFRELNTRDDASFSENALSKSEQKSTYLTALSGILSNSSIPSSILLPEIPRLLPLLLQSLDLDDQTGGLGLVRAATLETLFVMIRENASAITEAGHIDSLVTRLLRTAAYNTTSAKASQNNATVRRLALHCLLILPSSLGNGPDKKSSKADSLIPLKKSALLGLKVALDDPKRDVRKAAVDAKTMWSWHVGGDEEDDD